MNLIDHTSLLSPLALLSAFAIRAESVELVVNGEIFVRLTFFEIHNSVGLASQRDAIHRFFGISKIHRTIG